MRLLIHRESHARRGPSLRRRRPVARVLYEQAKVLYRYWPEVDAGYELF
jgi:hypothetical protein